MTEALTTFDEDTLQRKLASLRPETALPGFWESIAANCDQWAREISAGPFWAEIDKKLDQWRSEYRQATKGADLLARTGMPPFVGKSATSIKSKVFRKCRANLKKSEQIFSTAGAPVPALSDLVRTRIVCRYIDGVEFLATKMEMLAGEMGRNPKRDREGRLEGYFAQHLTVDADVFFRIDKDAIPAKIRCEIQLATELATKMWDASHPFYEFARERDVPAESWQWNPTDPQFIANQLGHMIHLADGLIVQLRHARGE